jgi:hypothetical protein
MKSKLMLRALLVLVLLAPAALRGQEIQKSVSRGKEPAPLKPQVTAQFHVPGQKGAPLMAIRNTFPALRAAFVKRELAKAQENKRRVEAHVAQLQRAGGLQAFLKKQLEEASRMNSKGGSPRLPKISAALRAQIESIAVCTTPKLFDITESVPQDLITVGSVSIIHGCHLGESPGTVQLRAPGSGTEFKMTPVYWHDSYIEVSMEDMTGIMDQPSVLQVTLPSGTTSNTIDVLVKAHRDVVLIAARPNSNVLTADCADTTNYDKCVSLFKDPQFQQVDHSIGGLHWSACCFNGVSDTDHYFISLKNGWVLGGGNSFPVSLLDGSTITCNPPYADDKGHVDFPTGFTVGAAVTTVDVHWSVEANCSEALYFLDMLIEGPKGVPFE